MHVHGSIHPLHVPHLVDPGSPPSFELVDTELSWLDETNRFRRAAVP